MIDDDEIMYPQLGILMNPFNARNPTLTAGLEQAMKSIGYEFCCAEEYRVRQPDGQVHDMQELLYFGSELPMDTPRILAVITQSLKIMDFNGLCLVRRAIASSNGGKPKFDWLRAWGGGKAWRVTQQ